MSKKKYAPRVTLEYLPALDLVVAADSAGPREIKPDYPKTSCETFSWRDRAREAASPFGMADLDLIFAPVSISVFLFYAVIRDRNPEIQDLIEYFRTMTDEAFLDKFRQFSKIEDRETDWIHIDVRESSLEKNRTPEKIPFREEARQLVELLGSPGMFRKKIVEVLSWFEEKVFSPVKDSCRSRVENWMSEKRPILESAAKDTLDSLLGDVYDSLLADREVVRLFPVTENANSDRCLMLPDEAYAVFTLDYAERVWPRSPKALDAEKLTGESIEALADPKRIAILRLLRRSPSTASYHIEKLINARLIRLELSSGRRFYYAINERGFKEMLERMEAEFIGD